MKKIKIFSIFAMFIISLCILASCTSSVDATGSLQYLKSTRYTLTLKATVTDKSRQITGGSVSIILYDSEGTRVTSSSCDSIVFPTISTTTTPVTSTSTTTTPVTSTGTSTTPVTGTSTTTTTISSTTSGTTTTTEEQDDNTLSETVTLTALESNTKYVAKLVCTIKDETVTLAEKEVKTNTAGSSNEEAIHISTVDDFQQMSNDLDGYYILDNDISIGTVLEGNDGLPELEEGKMTEWSPLFSNSTSKAFTGTFDGNGYTISNFKQTSSQSYYGFFGYLAEGATIKNLNFENVYIKCARYSDTRVGVVAGYADIGCTLENVNVTNVDITITSSSTSGKTFYVGGLIGENTGGNIKECELMDIEITVSGSKTICVGGIAGYNGPAQSFWIDDCTIKGSITITQTYNSSSTLSKNDQIVQTIGGAVGHNAGNIRNVICNVDITSKFELDDSVIENVYGKVDSEDESDDAKKEWKIDKELNVAVGMFCGFNSNTGMIKKCVTSGDLSFTSLNAYNVKLGLFCGYNVSKIGLAINEVAYINNNNVIDVILTEEDQKRNDKTDETNKEETSTQAEESNENETTENDNSSGTSDDTKKDEGLPYERILEFSFLGSESSTAIYYYELPTNEDSYYISSCDDLLGDSTAIENFNDAETFNVLIEELKKLF